MSLIEKEPIMKFIEDGLNNKHYGHVGVEIITEIEFAPVVDAAPVAHARWIPITLYGGEHAIKCSACNNCDNPSKVPGRYCWQCGAKMDAKGEGNAEETDRG